MPLPVHKILVYANIVALIFTAYLFPNNKVIHNSNKFQSTFEYINKPCYNYADNEINLKFTHDHHIFRRITCPC